MKLNFEWSNDGAYHQYCAHCHAETISRVYENDKTFYFCETCQQQHERSIVIDPAIKWWIDDTGEYWHESSGVFVRNPANKFLFFERTIFPFALTVPSGHVDTDEPHKKSAVRELKEEVGIDSNGLSLIASENIVGDSCRRGSDAHNWHAYLLTLKKTIEITVIEEGKRPVWLSLDEALQKDLIYPVQCIIEKYRHELTRPNPSSRSV